MRDPSDEPPPASWTKWFDNLCEEHAMFTRKEYTKLELEEERAQWEEECDEIIAREARFNGSRSFHPSYLVNAYFNQGQGWITARGERIPLSEMDTDHITNTLLYLERAQMDISKSGLRGQLQDTVLYRALRKELDSRVSPRPPVDVTITFDESLLLADLDYCQHCYDGPCCGTCETRCDGCDCSGDSCCDDEEEHYPEFIHTDMAGDVITAHRWDDGSVSITTVSDDGEENDVALNCDAVKALRKYLKNGKV